MKKIIVSCVLSSIFAFANSDTNINEKTNIQDISNLILMYNAYISKVEIEEKNKVDELLNLLDFNNKEEVILAISNLENQIFEKKF